MKLNELIHIVASKAKKIEELEESGQNWLDYFNKNNLINEGQNILDYGAGLGRISIPFSKVANVTAIDGNPHMIEYLKSKNIRAILSEDCSTVMNERFSFVICNYVLQHMHFPDAQNLVSQISQITDNFYFTYPIVEYGGFDGYIHFRESEKIELLKSHDFSRKMNLNELPILFEKSSFEPKTIRRLFSNLFEIRKNN